MEKVPESAHPISQRPVNFLSLLLVIYPMQLLFSALCSRSLSFQALKKIPHNLESQETNHHRPPTPNPCSIFRSQPLFLYFCSQNPLTQLSVFLPSQFSATSSFLNAFFGPFSHTLNLSTSLFLHDLPMLYFFPLKIHTFSHVEKPLETWPPLFFSKHPFFKASFFFFPPLAFQKMASFPMQSISSHIALHFSHSQSPLFFRASSLLPQLLMQPH